MRDVELILHWRSRAAWSALIARATGWSLLTTLLLHLLQHRERLCQFLCIESLVAVLVKTLNEHHGHLSSIWSLSLAALHIAIRPLPGIAVELRQKHLS